MFNSSLTSVLNLVLDGQLLILIKRLYRTKELRCVLNLVLDGQLLIPLATKEAFDSYCSDVLNLVLDGQLLILLVGSLIYIVGRVLNLVLDGQLLIPLFFEFIRIKGIFNFKI